jgi:hypothetical protein
MESESHNGSQDEVSDVSQILPAAVILNLSDKESRRKSTEPNCKHADGRYPVPENSTISTITIDAGFSTFDCVRSRSRAPNVPQGLPGGPGNFNRISELETFCDDGTWQWVCNHKQRSVSVWNVLPLRWERRQAK